ncbi:solute carrier family 25 member 45-like isoform X2 [Ostrea edulis]|uniref:solute carrier family 25 member 45-like isoform X2 n=1 Tax=Ostrea edulis TaxID=37623 RepID=UPI0024AF98B5|nr:solute carrier family 25 member 45-like isoform X2 [Ostrea edulis]
MEVEHVSSVYDYVSGAIAGSLGVVTGHPFDTVKVQLQIRQANLEVVSLRECYQAVKTQNLARGFFRGLSWPMLSYGIINSVFFGVYGSTMKLLNADISGKTPPDYTKICLAGGLGGLCQLVPAVPIDVIKVVLQSQIPHRTTESGGKYYKGPIEGTRDILRSRGFLGMYRGLPTQALRDVPASIAYFLIYEFLIYHGVKSFPNTSSTLQNFVFGGVAGVVSWALIMPFDVMKSRIQADNDRKLYSGFLDCVVKSYKSNGIKIFYRGLSLTSLRAFPVNGITLMSHIELMKLFGEKKHQA